MTELDRWIAALAADLGVDAPQDVDAVLDLARRAAHGVDRPAAPITTFVVGLAVGQGASLEESLRLAGALADGWADAGGPPATTATPSSEPGA